MDIADIVTSEFESFDVGTPVSKLRGAFEDPTLKAVVVTDDGDLEGVVTRRQVAASHHQPNEKVGSLVWHVPSVSHTEDIREVARLMVGSGSKVLPVVDGDLEGVVTADAVLEKVASFLEVVTVGDVATEDLVTVAPETTVGEVLHDLREHRITHLPVVEGDDLAGIVSLHDLIGFTTRTVEAAQGGSPGGFDEHGGEGSREGHRSHGGFGSRGGLDRLLDIPATDVMTEPVGTIRPDRPLDEAVEAMLEREVSSLVVVDGEESPTGIVTKTDVLEALTWTAEERRPVQVFGIDLLDDMSYDDVAEMIDDVARKYDDMSVLEAKIHLHEHDETLRGTPLLLARIRLFTDKGMFLASGEGYGATHALHLARNVLEREILEGKTYGQSKKHPDQEHWERLYGWWLTG